MKSLIPQAIRAFDKGNLTHVFNSFLWQTDIAAERELWLRLNSYSEIKERGLQLFVDHNSTHPHHKNKQWRVFGSYIRQARSYWDAARITSSRSSALLYYYCFMNLVKAWLMLKIPKFSAIQNHGLKYDSKNKVIKIVKKSSKHQILAQYYSQIYQITDINKIPQSLIVNDLFEHIISISDQVIDSGAGSLKSFPFRIASVFNSYSNKAWYVLAVKSGINWNDPDILKWFSDFLKIYEKVSITNPNNEICRLFDIRGRDCAGYDFFQLNNTSLKDVKLGLIIPENDLYNEFKKCLHGKVSGNHRLDHFDGYLNLPLNNNTSLWNEELSIYSLMFYLSNLVRYYPDILDAVLEDKSSWLVESFVASSPIQFLKIITSRIIKPDVIIRV